MITQERTSNLIGQPCEDNSFDAIAYKIELIAAVEKARASIKRGEFITHEELEKEYDSWNFE